MTRVYRRRLATLIIVIACTLVGTFLSPNINELVPQGKSSSKAQSATIKTLESLAVKGRSPKTGYARSQFGNGWAEVIGGCDTRNIILARDLSNERVDENCRILSGTLSDPYTGKTIQFMRGQTTSDDVQIDHVVALSNAWQTGAQQLSPLKRELFANDPLNLLAVDGNANQQKSDGDAATWLPPYKPFRCQYVGRQIKIKAKYHLWVTVSEKQAIQQVLAGC